MGAGSSKTGQQLQRHDRMFENSFSSDEPTESLSIESPAEAAAEAASAPRRRAPATRRDTVPSADRCVGTSSGASGGGGTRAASAADLTNQLQELDDTFSSLGIVGRQLGGESCSSPGSLDSSLGSAQLESQLDDGKTKSGVSWGSRTSRTSRRAQPFSWEERSSSQQDDWTYQKVTLDGFDPEKFKKANKGASFETDIRINRDFGARPKDAVPEYDHQDQQILASIERDFDTLIPL